MPLEASRKIASRRKRRSPSEANDGMGEPGVPRDGHFRWVRWAIWNRMPRWRRPIAVSAGALRLLVPEPAYVWHAVQPAAKSLAPGAAFLGRCSSWIQRRAWRPRRACGSLVRPPARASPCAWAAEHCRRRAHRTSRSPPRTGRAVPAARAGASIRTASACPWRLRGRSPTASGAAGPTN